MHVKIKDIGFKSPLLTASGTYGYGHEVQDIVDVNQWGGLITKSVTRHPREGNPPPRITETPSGMLNSIGLANLGVEKYCDEVIPFLNELQTQVIINIAGSFDNMARDLGLNNATTTEIPVGTEWNEWQDQWSGNPRTNTTSSGNERITTTYSLCPIVLQVAFQIL